MISSNVLDMTFNTTWYAQTDFLATFTLTLGTPGQLRLLKATLLEILTKITIQKEVSLFVQKHIYKIK